jgi:hypothetical protein
MGVTTPLEPVLGYADLARIFRRSAGHAPVTIKAWMRHRGFPPPLPGTKPLLWSAARVQEWIDAPDDAARLALAARTAADHVSGAVPDAVVAAARARLEARYQGRTA